MRARYGLLKSAKFSSSSGVLGVGASEGTRDSISWVTLGGADDAYSTLILIPLYSGDYGLR
jgi:hypothetical protein